MSNACGSSSTDKSAKLASGIETTTEDSDVESVVIHTTDAEFDKLLKSTDKPIVVDFWAPWCGPCKLLGPVIDELGSDYKDKAIIAKMNVDENRTTPSKFSIRGIPAVLVFQNGELKEKIVGLNSKATYSDVLDGLMGS